jgi:hypothetical protein
MRRTRTTTLMSLAAATAMAGAGVVATAPSAAADSCEKETWTKMVNGWKVTENDCQTPQPYDSGGKDADGSVKYKGKDRTYKVTGWFNAQGDNFFASNRTTKDAYFSFQYYKGGWKTAMSGHMGTGDTNYATWGFEPGPHWWLARKGYDLKEGRSVRVKVCAKTSKGTVCSTSYGRA